jgi:thiamine biosynthesis lipoprotein
MSRHRAGARAAGRGRHPRGTAPGAAREAGPRTARGAGALAVWALALALGALVPAAIEAGAKRPRERPRASDFQRATRARELWAGPCRAIAEGGDSVAAGVALDAALDAMARLGKVLAHDQAGSELERLNATAFENRVRCSPDLWSALVQAIEVARETDGAFDPTLASLGRAWDLRGDGRRPSIDELREALAATGWRSVQLEPGLHTARFPRPDLGIDLGAMARGVALDRAVDTLRARGVRRALVGVGGDAAAVADEGGAWAVPVGDPAGPGRAAVWLTVRRGAVATVSTLAEAFTVNGVRYSRWLDPGTGAPVPVEASVTVVTRSAARARGVAAALLVLGRERAMRFVESRPELGVLWLEPDGSTVRAWRWNLPMAKADPRAVVRWES